ncbi:uncharacterized protein BROUX77_006735 [Berkeleyomyces rouxiae]|uniref:uncharacterized protein n=1 Tax=Berkeleyomyces rouxiae TaxID=2035830 RepID=UPI003B7A5AEC
MSRDMGRKASIGTQSSQTPTTHLYDIFPAKSPSIRSPLARNPNTPVLVTTHRRRSKSLGSKSGPNVSHIHTASTSASVPKTLRRPAMPTMTPPQKVGSHSHHRKKSSDASAGGSSSAAATTPTAAAKRISENVRVFVGPEKQEFIVSRALLCACSPFFGDHLARGTNQLSLPTESSSMFELFAVWLHNPVGFPKHLHRALEHVEPEPGRTVDSAAASTRLHWTLVRLHLFAAVLELLPLQDLALDAIQDLYLCRDWDVTPRFISFLYTQCDPFASLRVRRWAVAMVAFALASAEDRAAIAERDTAASTDPASRARQTSTAAKDADELQELLARHPEFLADYEMHMRKMDESGLDLAMKNPQLRIPSNTLRNDQRRFAFRQCAFHTHRSTAGQGSCPYGGDDDVESRVGLIRKKSRAMRQQRRQAELQVQLQVQLDRQREHQALAAIHQVQQQQAGQTRHNHRVADDDQDGDYTVAPPSSIRDRSHSRSRSRTQPHISKLSLADIPESRSSPDKLGPLPPLPTKSYSPLPSTTSPSVPRSRLASRGTHSKSYSASAAVPASSASSSRAALPAARMPKRHMTDFSAPVPEVETPSTSPTPYLRPAAPIAESIATASGLTTSPGKLTLNTSIAGGALTASPPSTVSGSLKQQIRDQTAKLARHNASFQASTRLQRALPESPTYASPTLGYAASAMFAAFPSPDSPAPAMRKAQGKKPMPAQPPPPPPQQASPQKQKQKQHPQPIPPHKLPQQPRRAATTPARIEDYLDRKLPDPPTSPAPAPVSAYHLAMPHVDIDAEIRSLSALLPPPSQTPTSIKARTPTSAHAPAHARSAAYTSKPLPPARKQSAAGAPGPAPAPVRTIPSNAKLLSHSKSFSHATASVTATAFASAAAKLHHHPHHHQLGHGLSSPEPSDSANSSTLDVSAVDALLDEVAISLHIAQYAATSSSGPVASGAAAHHGHGHGLRVAAA